MEKLVLLHLVKIIWKHSSCVLDTNAVSNSYTGGNLLTYKINMEFQINILLGNFSISLINTGQNNGAMEKVIWKIRRVPYQIRTMPEWGILKEII